MAVANDVSEYLRRGGYDVLMLSERESNKSVAATTGDGGYALIGCVVAYGKRFTRRKRIDNSNCY